MKITIHRGAKEIGGSCIELQSGVSRILLDFGLPLVVENRARIDNKSIAQLDILPPVQGLYKDDKPHLDAILISHPHQDHYGLLSFVNKEIPIYMSRGCKALIDISCFFGQTVCNLASINTVEAWHAFSVGSFTITPYLVDHSGFDSLAFLIECEGKRIFYSGDFRGHGRKSILFRNMLKRPVQDIDYLILEGSTFGREKGDLNSESDVEERLLSLFQDKELAYFIACSSQNIDRLVSIYRACLKSNRVFVIDPYTAFVLDMLKDLSPKLPQFDWGENIRIFFAPNSYTKKLADENYLYKYQKAKITYSEMQRIKSSLIIKDSYATREYFARKKGFNNTFLIYSMWEGYLTDAIPFWKGQNVPICKVHVSGHACIDDLKAFVNAIKPKHIIPNHTFYPEYYSENFGNNVMLINDGIATEL